MSVIKIIDFGSAERISESGISINFSGTRMFHPPEVYSSILISKHFSWTKYIFKEM